MGGLVREQHVRVVIAGGGTGGHLYPGLAVAKELVSRHPDAEISFAGTAKGLEARVVPLEGFALDLIRSSGLKGKSAIARVRGAALLVPSVLDAWRVVARRRPHIVIGVGGYSSFPVVLVAALRRIPTMVLEQNAVPGLANRMLAPFVRAAAVTFESTKAFFGEKAFVSGNPVRPEFLRPVDTNAEAKTDDASTGTEVLVFGGSQGAHAINMAMVEAAEELASHRPFVHITHQTGERDVEMVRSRYEAAGLVADVAAYYDNISREIGRADLIVCRAGATTIAEITAAAKPSVLIPLPTATDDHQRKNAEALAAAGAAEVLLQSEATGRTLAQRITALAADRPRRRQMGLAARRFARPDAARVVVDRILELARRARPDVR